MCASIISTYTEGGDASAAITCRFAIRTHGFSASGDERNSATRSRMRFAAPRSRGSFS